MATTALRMTSAVKASATRPGCWTETIAGLGCQRTTRGPERGVRCVSHADPGAERAADARRTGHADGRDAAPLLAPGDHRRRARRGAGPARHAAGREPGGVSHRLGPRGPGRPPVPAPR